jgi:hypothetical protein
MKYKTWLSVSVWCRRHPSKLAAVVSPDGVFEVKYIPKGEMKGAEDVQAHHLNLDWVIKRFLDEEGR